MKRGTAIALAPADYPPGKERMTLILFVHVIIETPISMSTAHVIAASMFLMRWQKAKNRLVPYPSDVHQLEKQNYPRPNQHRALSCPSHSRYGDVKFAGIYAPEMLHQKYAPYAKPKENGLSILSSHTTLNCCPP